MVQQQPTPRRHQLHQKLAAVSEPVEAETIIRYLSLNKGSKLLEQLLRPQLVSLPTAEELSVEAILQGMQQAEAAQQQLMPEGKLADAAQQGNKAISSILVTHSRLQRLYHKAMQGFSQQYGQLAVTPEGAWMLCDNGGWDVWCGTCVLTNGMSAAPAA
jgi:hypothetical protein